VATEPVWLLYVSKFPDDAIGLTTSNIDGKGTVGIGHAKAITLLKAGIGYAHVLELMRVALNMAELSKHYAALQSDSSETLFTVPYTYRKSLYD
jgi:hypothetical protein